MPRLRRPSGTKALLAFGLVLMAFGAAGRSGAAADQEKLQLDVVINGIPRNVIGSFVQFADGRIASAPKELEELGINSGGRRFANELVQLDDIPSLRYRYDERMQKIEVTIDNAQRQGRNYD